MHLSKSLYLTANKYHFAVPLQYFYFIYFLALLRLLRTSWTMLNTGKDILKLYCTVCTLYILVKYDAVDLN